MRTYTYAYVRTYVRTYIHCTSSDIYMMSVGVKKDKILARKTDIYTLIRTHTLTHTHTYTHAHTHTHTKYRR